MMHKAAEKQTCNIFIFVSFTELRTDAAFNSNDAKCVNSFPGGKCNKILYNMA